MYPVEYEVDFNPHPSRGTTFFRIILAIPWVIVGLVYAIAFAFTHFFAWVAIVVIGRYPAGLYVSTPG
jgi:ABC-type sugar transport system permease subunit